MWEVWQHFYNIPDSSDVLSTSWRVFIIASRQLWTGAERIFEVIDETTGSSRFTGGRESGEGEGRGGYEGSLVRLPTGKMILKGISFQAAAGRKIALVGATGAGKRRYSVCYPDFLISGQEKSV